MHPTHAELLSSKGRHWFINNIRFKFAVGKMIEIWQRHHYTARTATQPDEDHLGASAASGLRGRVREATAPKPSSSSRSAKRRAIAKPPSWWVRGLSRVK